jgi:integrase
MRLGEILTLKWNDCDLENGVISVHSTMAYAGHGYQVESPKTKRGIRPISLSNVVIQSLLEHRQQSNTKLLPDNLIIQIVGGQSVLQCNLRLLFYNLIKQAQLAKIRIYDLRHTHKSGLDMHPFKPHGISIAMFSRISKKVRQIHSMIFFHDCSRRSERKRSFQHP